MFSLATVMRKGLQSLYLVKMNCFNLVHTFFFFFFSVQHVFCCNVTDLHIQNVHAISSYYNIHCGWKWYRTATNTHTRISVWQGKRQTNGQEEKKDLLTKNRMILGQSKPWARGEDLLMRNRRILGQGTCRPWERGEDLLTKNRLNGSRM